MLKLLGFLIGLTIALLPFAVIVYAFGGKEKLDQYLLNQFIKKSLAEKVEMIMKKDSSPKYAEAGFYIGNNYHHRISQTEWIKYCQERLDPSLDKNSQEYAEAVAPIVNAIVVNRFGYYLRRGMEDLARAYKRILPGAKDRISLNYFAEPYNYVENKELAAKSLAEEALRNKEYEETHGTWQEREAARLRCKKCANFTKCDRRVREQTGPCGGYTPR